MTQIHDPHSHEAGHHHDEHGHDHHRHEHRHGHPHAGLRGFLYDLFVPHTHDAADSIDDALEASTSGVRALKISLFMLLGTSVLQFALVLVTGSVALWADTIHNFSGTLTALPLWIAFVLARCSATRRYTFGCGRAEDLAGLFIVAVVALSAIVARWEAFCRVRIGQKIGSAALVADGVHARIDGFTSLSVVVGAVGVILGFPSQTRSSDC